MAAGRVSALMVAKPRLGHRLCRASSPREFQEIVMYTVIQRHTFDPGSSAALSRNIAERFVPLLRQAPGFVAYYWLDTGAGTGASLCVFEDRVSADAALDLAAGFIFEHL